MRNSLLTIKLIVCDAGPLIALGKIGQLQLLNHLYTEIYVPDVVLKECLVNETLPGAQAIKIALANKQFIAKSPLTSTFLEKDYSILDAGEKEAILLAKELKASVLIDEKRGRTVANSLSLKVIGTAGLLLSAYKKGFVSNLKECLDLLQESGYRLSDRLIEDVLKRAQTS